MAWNKTAAVAHARWRASASSTGNCAAFTREAIEAGGVNIGHTSEARNYGPLLESKGFRPIGVGETPREGDVVIIQPYPGGRREGHMAIFDGQTWFSDFRQRDMWGGPGYRKAHPQHVIYRKN